MGTALFKCSVNPNSTVCRLHRGLGCILQTDYTSCKQTRPSLRSSVMAVLDPRKYKTGENVGGFASWHPGSEDLSLWNPFPVGGNKGGTEFDVELYKSSCLESHTLNSG